MDIGRGDEQFRVVDYWDRLTGKSWKRDFRDPKILEYALRIARSAVPADDNVLVGLDRTGASMLVHRSELA
jgi:hypothetical protein